MRVTAVVGGQYGSEGKGLIVGHIAKRFDAHVRVGAANAGHTIWLPDALGHKEKHVLQSIPVAAYANPEAKLYIGPGALISEEILVHEIGKNLVWREKNGIRPALSVTIDPRAHVITPQQIEVEARSSLAASIGSTSTIAKEGIGMAQAARVMRNGLVPTQTVGDSPSLVHIPNVVIDEIPLLLHQHRDVLLEGTQGTGLSLTTGDYPYVTSRNTTVAGLCGDTGVPKADNVIVVMRTFPIRVAGNSGPFYHGSRETSFEEIGVPPELTTVTKLQRRIATFSMEQAEEAVRINGADAIALTFGDYVAPSMAGLTDFDDPTDPKQETLRQLLIDLQRQTGAYVEFVGTGPASVMEVMAMKTHAIEA